MLWKLPFITPVTVLFSLHVFLWISLRWMHVFLWFFFSFSQGEPNFFRQFFSLFLMSLCFFLLFYYPLHHRKFVSRFSLMTSTFTLHHALSLSSVLVSSFSLSFRSCVFIYEIPKKYIEFSWTWTKRSIFPLRSYLSRLFLTCKF